MDQQPKASWNAHPGVVVLGMLGVVIGIIVGISALFSQVVIPTMLKDKDLQIAELNKRIEPLEKATHESAERLAALNKELGQLKLRNAVLSRQDIFSIEDVYPKGFRGVRIGDPLQRIGEVYPAKDIEKNDDDNPWVSVIIRDEQLFRSVTYYKAYKGRNVSQILFHLQNPSDFELVKQQLAETYGAAKIHREKKSWVLTVLRYDLELDEPSGFGSSGTYFIKPATRAAAPLGR